MTTLEITFLITTIAMIGLLMMVLERNTSFDDFKKKRGVPRMENPPPPPERMKKEEFIVTMKLVCSRSDFEENGQVLEMIEGQYYQDIIDLSYAGFPIPSSINAVPVLIKMSRQTALTTGDVISLLAAFEHLLSLKRKN